MSDRDAFLAAIRSAPDDDAPRLVYADWLEENGDPDLAEFIRLQIEIDPLRRPDTDLDRWRRATIDLHLDRPVPEDFPANLHRYADLVRREQELLNARRWDWLAPLAAVGEDYNSHLAVTFRRGIAEEVGIATSAFLEAGEAVREACPNLGRLTLYGPRDRVPELVASAALHGIPELDLAGWITEYDARFLVGWLAFHPVRSLTMWLGSRADEEVVRRLAAGPAAGDLMPTEHKSPRLTTATYLGDLRELVLVQLNGGMQAWGDAADLAKRACDLAAVLNDRLGRPVARVKQPFARRFPLAESLGYGLFAGHLPSGPALMSAGLRLDYFRFDDDGEFLGEGQLGMTPRLAEIGRLTGANVRKPELLQALWEAHGFRPGPIFGREFDAEESEVRVYLWGAFEDVVADPDARSDGDDHEEACASLDWYWMKGGNFIVYSGTDYIAGPDGIIHSS